MARKNLIILFALTVLVAQAIADRAKVALFYETHCPDSQAIMNLGLQKSLDLLDEVEIDLVPYGKASTFGDGSSLSFQCQHGQPECDGNMYHACAIDIQTNKTQLFNFVICTMSKRQSVLNYIEPCAKQNNINYVALKQCFSSQKGRELFKIMGEKTRDAAKIINNGLHLDFVPSTIIDGTPKVYESYPNLRRAICSHAKPRPSKC